jgi:hypothetical protein
MLWTMVLVAAQAAGTSRDSVARAMPAASAVILQVERANIRVEASADTLVHVVTTPQGGCTRGDGDITSESSGGGLTVNVRSVSRCTVNVLLRSPRTQRLDIRQKEGSVTVTGRDAQVRIRGGVVAGQFTDVTGDADVHTDVGDLLWLGAGDRWRSFDLTSGVGHVEYAVDGTKLRYGRAPGSGEAIFIPAPASAARVTLKTGVGAVRVRMASAGLSPARP